MNLKFPPPATYKLISQYAIFFMNLQRSNTYAVFIFFMTHRFQNL